VRVCVCVCVCVCISLDDYSVLFSDSSGDSGISLQFQPNGPFVGHSQVRMHLLAYSALYLSALYL